MSTQTIEHTIISVEIEPQLKKAVETVLTRQGMTVSEAIYFLFRHIATHQTFPSELRTPNQETLQALEAPPTEDVYRNAKELFDFGK